jgi:hypothetical protein
MFTAIRNASSRVSRLAADRGQLPQCEMSLMADTVDKVDLPIGVRSFGIF